MIETGNMSSSDKNFRTLKRIERYPGKLIFEGKAFLDLTSNDYLGLSENLQLQKDFLSNLPDDRFLLGSLSSRLLTGNCGFKEEFENYIARSYGKEACLLYNSGYHINTGLLPALAGKNDFILADKLVHASIIDGIRLARCPWQRFRHNDLDDLEGKLKKASEKYKKIYVVTEGIFSMDGDIPDLHSLLTLKNKYPFFLYIDEAHSFGVRGNMGLGMCEELEILEHVDIIIATFGKALAGEGAFAVCNNYIRQHLINHSRSLIYSTAAAPLSTLWTQHIFKHVLQMEQKRKYLQDISFQLRSRLQDHFSILGRSHILPLLFENIEQCQDMIKVLHERGIYVLPIRYPTVPINSPRIRLSLTAALSYSDLEKIYGALLA